jgi:hypothetical protein
MMDYTQNHVVYTVVEMLPQKKGLKFDIHHYIQVHPDKSLFFCVALGQ